MRLDEQEIDAALRELPDAYAPWLPTIRQIVIDNLRAGRVQRILGQGDGRSLADYVRQVARVLRAEFENLEQLSRHDDGAWEPVQRALRARAYFQLMRLGVDHAEAYDRANDFAQEACVALLKARYPGDVPYLAWAKRILRHQILQDMRRQPDLLDKLQCIVSLQADEAEDRTPPNGQTEDFILAVEDRQAIEWALGQLPSDAQREVLRRELAGWTDEEIAARTGRSVQAVYNLRHRARQEMKRLLGSPDHQGDEAPSR